MTGDSVGSGNHPLLPDERHHHPTITTTAININVVGLNITNGQENTGRMTPEEHYDSKAELVDRGERSKLRNFHNEAKRVLLGIFAKRAASLLDIACGRGGDVHKWSMLAINRAHGLDISSRSVQEARERTAAARYAFTFSVADVSKPLQVEPTHAVVTCFFALHYFFGSEECAGQVLENVANALRPGGVFVGVTMSGRQVLERIKVSGTFDNGTVRLAPRWQGAPQCFGSAYNCSIRDTIVEGSETAEYLVFQNVLEGLAAAHGLEPIHDWGPEARKICVGEGAWRRLRPPYTGPMAECTNLYAAFAFRKVTPS
ncbi:mRNA cap guanine-N7 methyltransferase [Chlorella vulgaris]